MLDDWYVLAPTKRPGKQDTLRQTSGSTRPAYFLQSKAWVKAGKRLKFLRFEDIKKVDGIWVIHKLSAKTKKGKSVESTTVMVYSELKLNDKSITDKDFSQREMEK